MQSAIKMKKNFYLLLVIFGILTIPILAFFVFHICTLVNINILNAKEINYGFGITSGILWLIGWIIFFIDIVYVNSYTDKQCKLIVNYFNTLVQDKKLIADLKKYPVIFIMSFYYENRSQFIIDYPNTYPAFAPFLVVIGQSIFFDRLYDYINQINKI